jgi:Lon-like ATP-dependent protease
MYIYIYIYKYIYVGVSVTITEEALNKLVRNYCRESGVRSLEKHIEKIARKVAFNAVEDQEKTTENHGDHTETVISEIDLNNQKILDTINSLNNFKSVLSDEEKPTIDIIMNSTNNVEHSTIKDTPTLVHVNVDNLEEYVGKPKFTQVGYYDDDDICLYELQTRDEGMNKSIPYVSM